MSVLKNAIKDNGLKMDLGLFNSIEFDPCCQDCTTSCAWNCSAGCSVSNAPGGGGGIHPLPD